MKRFLAILCLLCTLCLLSFLCMGCTTEPPAGVESGTAADDTDTASSPESTIGTVTETQEVTLAQTQPVTVPETEPATEPETVPDTLPLTEAQTEPATEPATAPETKEDTMPETIPETVPVTEPETKPSKPIAGTDSGIVRDGTPKKYFTLRFDDGITQDTRVMEILRKYGMDCCTFYINTGLLGWLRPDWGDQQGYPGVSHNRYSLAELRDGVYNGFDVAVHTQTHASVYYLEDDQIIDEVAGDAFTISRVMGYQPIGMAWPGGLYPWTEHAIEVILATTDIGFGSCPDSSGNFALPEYFMTWHPTCNFSEGWTMGLAKQFLATEPEEDMLFYVWCHGYELDMYNTWDRFEQMIAMIAEAAAQDDSIVLVTNSEFYQLFKDEIPSWKE